MDRPENHGTHQQDACCQDSRFIALEGIDGSGKSTQVHKIKEFLEDRQQKVVTTREPSEKTQSGKLLRQLLTQKDFDKTTPETLLLLFFAARAEHIETLLRPALEQGFWVISDRFVHSSYAYQGALSGQPDTHLDHFDIDYLTCWICQNCMPSLVILLDLDEEEAQKRIQEHRFFSEKDSHDPNAMNNRREQHCFDLSNIAFQKRIRAEYLALAKRNPAHWQVVSAAQTAVKVTHDIHAVLKSRFFEKGGR